jgi:hypothetical protein
MSNPYAGGFTDANDRSVREGDRVRYLGDRSEGRLNEALQDGDASFTMDDGTVRNVKWCRLIKV